MAQVTNSTLALRTSNNSAGADGYSETYAFGSDASFGQIVFGFGSLDLNSIKIESFSLELHDYYGPLVPRTRTLSIGGLSTGLRNDFIISKPERLMMLAGDAIGTLTLTQITENPYRFTLSPTVNPLMYQNLISILENSTRFGTVHNVNLLITSSKMTDFMQVTNASLTLIYGEKKTASVPTVEQNGAAVSSAAKGSTVTIKTNRASADLLHTIYYYAGDVPVTIGTAEAVGASVNWTIPVTLGDNVKIWCQTFSDGVQVGIAQSVLLVLTQASGGGAPTINSVSVSDVETAIYTKFGSYVRGKSRLAVAINATAATGTTITGYRTTIDGQTYTGQSITTMPLMVAGARSLTVSVTGSTGDVATETQTVNVLDYANPTLSSFSVLRCDDEGDPDPAGEYVKLTATGAVSSMSGRNDISAVLKFRLSGSGTDWDDITGTDLTVSGYDLDLDGAVLNLGLDPSETAYDFRIELSDYFTTITQQTGTEHKYPLLEFVKNQYAQFHVPVRLPDDSPLAVAYGGTGNTSLEPLIQTILGRIPTPSIDSGDNYVILGSVCVLWGENTIYSYSSPKSTNVSFTTSLPTGKTFKTAPKIMAMPEWSSTPGGTAVISAMVQTVTTTYATLWINCNSSASLGTIYVPWIAIGVLNA